jgi:hypothetical protein
MGEKETATESERRSNAAPVTGDDPAEDRMKAGLDTAGGALASGASREAAEESSTRQTPKRDFGDRMKAGLETAGEAAEESSTRQTPKRDFGD